MNVLARRANKSVAEAGMWALSHEDSKQLKAEIRGLRAKGALAETEQGAIMGKYGMFLGNTNGDGQLFHTFDKENKHILVTAKKGYRPGFSRITITAPKVIEPSPLAESAQ